MVKLDGASLLHVGLLGCSSIHPELRGVRRWRQRVTDGGMPRGGSALSLRRTPLPVTRAVAVERRPWAVRLVEQSRAVLHRRAELLLGALDAGLDGLRPVSATLAEVCRAHARGRLGRFRLHIPPRAYRVKRCARRRRDTDAVWVVLEAAFNPVPRRKESIEALDEVRVASE